MAKRQHFLGNRPKQTVPLYKDINWLIERDFKVPTARPLLAWYVGTLAHVNLAGLCPVNSHRVKLTTV